MHLMSKVSNTDINCSFLNSIPLSGKINLEHKVLGRISLIYAIETSSAILRFSGTIIIDEVNKQINVRACLLPFDAAGSGPMQSWHIQ